MWRDLSAVDKLTGDRLVPKARFCRRAIKSLLVPHNISQHAPRPKTTQSYVKEPHEGLPTVDVVFG